MMFKLSKFAKRIVEANIPTKRTKDISREEFKSLLMTNCKDFIHNFDEHYLIYRGIKGYESDFGIVDPKSVQRHTQDSNNIYTVLIDFLLSSWKGFPKRSNSLICSTNHKYASMYSKGKDFIYIMVPFDGAQYGICNNSDIWYSFSNLFNYLSNIFYPKMISMGEFNDKICHLLSVTMAIYNNVTYDNSDAGVRDVFRNYDLNKIKEYIDIFDEVTQTTDFDKVDSNSISPADINALREYQKEQGEPLLSLLNRIMAPNNNNISKGGYTDALKSHGEVWTDSKCLVAKFYHGTFQSELFDIMEELKSV